MHATKSLFVFDFRRHPICAYSTDTATKVFKGAKDRYNGITIDSSQEKFNVQKFSENLEGW